MNIKVYESRHGYPMLIEVNDKAYIVNQPSKGATVCPEGWELFKLAFIEKDQLSVELMQLIINLVLEGAVARG